MARPAKQRQADLAVGDRRERRIVDDIGGFDESGVEQSLVPVKEQPALGVPRDRELHAACPGPVIIDEVCQTSVCKFNRSSEG